MITIHDNNKSGVYDLHKLNMARWTHLRPEQAVDITESIQLNG